MEIRRSKVNPSARAHAVAQATMQTHGTPARFTRVKTFGSRPSIAMAKGSRVYDIVNAVKVPRPSIEPTKTIDAASNGPPKTFAASTQAPVVKRSGGSPPNHTASSGRQ